VNDKTDPKPTLDEDEKGVVKSFEQGEFLSVLTEDRKQSLEAMADKGREGKKTALAKVKCCEPNAIDKLSEEVNP